MNSATLVKLFLMILIASFCSSASAQKEYKGFLVIDQEMKGFFPCGGGKAVGIGEGDKLLEKTYLKYKKSPREPLYFVFLGEETSTGEYGIGPVLAPASTYLKSDTILRVERHERITCGAKIPSDTRIEVLYVAP